MTSVSYSVPLFVSIIFIQIGRMSWLYLAVSQYFTSIFFSQTKISGLKWPSISISLSKIIIWNHIFPFHCTGQFITIKLQNQLRNVFLVFSITNFNSCSEEHLTNCLLPKTGPLITSPNLFFLFDHSKSSGIPKLGKYVPT